MELLEHRGIRLATDVQCRRRTKSREASPAIHLPTAIREATSVVVKVQPTPLVNVGRVRPARQRGRPTPGMNAAIAVLQISLPAIRQPIRAARADYEGARDVPSPIGRRVDYGRLAVRVDAAVAVERPPAGPISPQVARPRDIPARPRGGAERIQQKSTEGANPARVLERDPTMRLQPSLVIRHRLRARWLRHGRRVRWADQGDVAEDVPGAEVVVSSPVWRHARAEGRHHAQFGDRVPARPGHVQLRHHRTGWHAGDAQSRRGTERGDVAANIHFPSTVRPPVRVIVDVQSAPLVDVRRVGPAAQDGGAAPAVDPAVAVEEVSLAPIRLTPGIS